MLTQTIDPSASLAEATDRFLADLRAWMDHCMATYGPLPPTDVHDQGTYTTAWEPYLRATQNEAGLNFMLSLRDQISDHYQQSGQWQHGYWTMQEAHHGTEHFELFLGTLFRLKPDDPVTAAQLVDVAEHMGNWSEAVPAWFDWSARLFKSLFFGSQGVQLGPGREINSPDHLRCLSLSLLAYQASGQERFRAFSLLYGGHWVEALLAEEAIPIGLTAAGPLYDLAGQSEAVYRSFMGEAPDLDSAVDRAENFLTSDAINIFLTLWSLSGDDAFRRAAEKLLDILVTQLADPDAGAAAAAVRDYRRHTGGDRYDQAVLDAAAPLAPGSIQALTLDAGQAPGRRASGVGKRGDLPTWLEDGRPRRHNPITLAVAAEIKADPVLARQAVDLARTYFALARQAFPDGRDHGCAARSVSAIARGHGRENHAGMTTAVLGPVLDQFGLGG